MLKILKIIQLDLLAIKPYLTMKNLVIYLGFFVFYAVTMKNAEIVFTLIAVFSALYITYPFLVTDEAGLDSLYTIFGISGSNIVTGRYGFLFLVNLIVIMASGLLYIILSFILSKEFTWTSLCWSILGAGLASTLLSFIQLPFLFKFAYKKAKLIIYVSIMTLSILIYGLVMVLSQTNLLIHILELPSGILALIGLIVYGLLFLLSYKSSLWAYRHKEY